MARPAGHAAGRRRQAPPPRRVRADEPRRGSRAEDARTARRAAPDMRSRLHVKMRKPMRVPEGEGGLRRDAVLCSGGGSGPVSCEATFPEPVHAILQAQVSPLGLGKAARMRSFVHSVYKAASEAVLPVKSKPSFQEDGVSAPGGRSVLPGAPRGPPAARARPALLRPPARCRNSATARDC